MDAAFDRQADMYKHEVSSQPREDSQTSNRTLTEDEDEEETGGGQTQDILWSHLALRADWAGLLIFWLQESRTLLKIPPENDPAVEKRLQEALPDQQCFRSSVSQASSQNSTAMPPVVTSSAAEPFTPMQYCRWPCECPAEPPACPLGVSLLTDGCGCCKACAQQVGEVCNEADTCDHHKGLYCDYSSDKPRYEKGLCAYMVGTGCEHDGVIYRNGQSFQPSCKYQCVCVNGAIGCVPLCTESKPPRVWCQNPRRVKVRGQCCEEWICDEPRRGRKAAPRHAVEAPPAELSSWHENCVSQTTSWSPCSKTCGRGLSLRVSNANRRCELVKESRLCNLRPCDVEIAKHIKTGKKCLNVYRGERPSNMSISGCTSTRQYWPKFCGVCTDERCCIPYKSKTVDVDFVCPDGSTLSWKMMWVQACFCNLSCKNPNDIFADLENYYGYPEVMN